MIGPPQATSRETSQRGDEAGADESDASERELGDGLHGRSAVRRSQVPALDAGDDFARESLAIDLNQRLRGERVAAILDRVARKRGIPEKIRVDNGPELTRKVLDQSAYVNKVRLDFTRRGKPTDTGPIGAFNSRLRAECRNENRFMSIGDARQKVEAWRRHYNEDRPHSTPGSLAPWSSLLHPAGRARPDRAEILTLRLVQHRGQEQKPKSSPNGWHNIGEKRHTKTDC